MPRDYRFLFFYFFKRPFFRDEIEPGSMERSPTEGNIGNMVFIRVLYNVKIYSQKGYIKSYQMWSIVPRAGLQYQHQSDADGKNLCKSEDLSCSFFPEQNKP